MYQQDLVLSADSVLIYDLNKVLKSYAHGEELISQVEQKIEIAYFNHQGRELGM